MRFRLPYVRHAAQQIVSGGLRLVDLHAHSCAVARDELQQLNGVGRKIADCVLLFAYGFQKAFPVDVWVMKALRQLYFPGRRPTPHRLRSPRPTSARTPATRSNIFSTTCAPARAVCHAARNERAHDMMNDNYFCRSATTTFAGLPS